MALFKEVFRKEDAPKNAALDRAMHEMAKDDNAKTRASLYKTVFASTFIVPGNVSGGTEVRKGTWIADSNTRVAFKTVEHRPENIALTVSTNTKALTSCAGP